MSRSFDLVLEPFTVIIIIIIIIIINVPVYSAQVHAVRFSFFISTCLIRFYPFMESKKISRFLKGQLADPFEQKML